MGLCEAMRLMYFVCCLDSHAVQSRVEYLLPAERPIFERTDEILTLNREIYSAITLQRLSSHYQENVKKHIPNIMRRHRPYINPFAPSIY